MLINVMEIEEKCDAIIFIASLWWTKKCARLLFFATEPYQVNKKSTKNNVELCQEDG